MAPKYERTRAGDQALIDGAAPRTMPRTPLRATQRQADDLGPLFAGPEEGQQLTIDTDEGREPRSATTTDMP